MFGQFNISFQIENYFYKSFFISIFCICDVNRIKNSRYDLYNTKKIRNNKKEMLLSRNMNL